MIEQELAEVKARVQHLENELGMVKKVLQQVVNKQGGNIRQQNLPDPAGPGSSFDPAAAEATFRQALVTLRTIAGLRNERFIFLATADPQNMATSGPQPVQPLLTDEIKPLLGKLGAALSNPARLKMLFSLMAQEESTTGLLAEASGVSGGNLFQQLNELYSANLIFQPSRGKYRLTDAGRLTIGVLAWAVSNSGKPVAQPGWFDLSPENQS